jgi:hypothetical protein
MIFYFSLLCPGSDKFKNKWSSTSSHHNIRTDTLPLPLFYNNKKASVGRLHLHRYMWLLLWRSDWGAEFFLTAPAPVNPTYTKTGGLYSKETVLCIVLPMAAMQQNTDRHRSVYTSLSNKNRGQTQFIHNNYTSV